MNVPGDDRLARVLPLVYDQLRRLARHHLRAERTGHTLDTGALAHEAYLALLRERSADLGDRKQFFGLASIAMRRILVDYARRRRARKRGPAVTEPLDEELAALSDERVEELLNLERALEGLAAVSPRAVRVVECRFFAGLGVDETAEVLEISAVTVRRDWVFAKAWLKRAVESG